MTDEAREVWLEQLCSDLAHKTLAELMDGCRRIRTNDDIRWFPGSGVILAACKSPWDDPKPRRYQPLEGLSEPLPPGRAKELIERTRKKYTGVTNAGRAPEIVADRPPTAYAPSDPDVLGEMRERLAAKLPSSPQERGE